MTRESENILVIGASGMLGTALCNLWDEATDRLTQAAYPVENDAQIELDITDAEAVEKLIDQVKPDLVFNCSAFTDVDGAETHEDQATAVNGHGAGHLARACAGHHSFLLHVSTDYVFQGNGKTPYLPDDPPGPQSAYGRSKLLGEEQIKAALDDWSIVRTSWLFGQHGKNFVDAILKLTQKQSELKVVDDQIGCPTYTVDLARCLKGLARRRARGVYHFSNGPPCTWFDFAKRIIEITHCPCEISPCGTDAFPRPAPRPAFSVLDCSYTFDRLGWTARPWPIALQDYLQAHQVRLT